MRHQHRHWDESEQVIWENSEPLRKSFEEAKEIAVNTTDKAIDTFNQVHGFDAVIHKYIPSTFENCAWTTRAILKSEFNKTPKRVREISRIANETTWHKFFMNLARYFT